MHSKYVHFSTLVVTGPPEDDHSLITTKLHAPTPFARMMCLAHNMHRSDSRIPETLFGTAEEDALRRDFTVNALFYNVNEGKVEDMTGR